MTNWYPWAWIHDQAEARRRVALRADVTLPGETAGGCWLTTEEYAAVRGSPAVPAAPCSSCGKSVDPAQVKSSPQAIEAFLREQA